MWFKEINLKFCPKCNKEATDFETKCEDCNLILVVSNESYDPNLEEKEYSNGKQHSDYLVLAIIALLFFFITGLISIVYAVKANTYGDCGNHEKAVEYSERSKSWIIISFVLSLIFFIFRLAIYL